MFFPSKRDLWLGILMWVFLIPVGAFGIFSGTSWLIKGLFIGVFVFTVWIWFGTGYTIKDGQLKIRTGPFKQIITIHDITEIKEAKNYYSSAALSLDRMGIWSKSFFIAYISPREKDLFIQEIQKVNPNIVIIKRKKA